MRLKFAVPMLLLLLLCACGAGETSAQTPVSFRTGLKEAEGCSFISAVTADYGDYIRQFTLECDCALDSSTLTVREPDNAAGIIATVSGETATVSFGDTILAVEEFATRKISPMAAPYLLERAWCEGYISSTGRDGMSETVEYLLGYGSDELIITTVFEDGIPLRAEISDGKNSLVTCEISDFSMK